MKKFGKILLICFAVLCVLLTVAISLTIGWRPFIGPKKRAVTNRQFEGTPERLAPGGYLVHGVLACETCHSPKDWTRHGGPVAPGMELTDRKSTRLNSSHV